MGSRSIVGGVRRRQSSRNRAVICVRAPALSSLRSRSGTSNDRFEQYLPNKEVPPLFRDISPTLRLPSAAVARARAKRTNGPGRED